MNTPNLETALKYASGLIDQKLEEFLVVPDAPEGRVIEAMKYTLMGGGKRLRAFLCIQTAKLFNVEEAHYARVATAIECAHSYSLVHDDLPAMDDDDLRRGRLTIHKKWDDATAILVGDALQALAFELTLNTAVPNSDKLGCNLAKAAGAKGMVMGQALDICAEKSTAALTLDDIINLQQGKTGALIRWAVTAGAFMANDNVKPLENYAKSVGLAFQIADDLLDATGDQIKAGKKLMKDASANKATFVSLMGVDSAKKKAQDLIDEACESIAVYGQRSDTLKQAAKFVISRDY